MYDWTTLSKSSKKRVRGEKEITKIGLLSSVAVFWGPEKRGGKPLFRAGPSLYLERVTATIYMELASINHEPFDPPN